MDLIGILHDLLHYFAGILFAYGLGWVHGAKSYKHFIERKEPPCPPPAKP